MNPSTTANQQNLALFFFESNLAHKFFKCFEEESSNNELFQKKLSELCNIENYSYQGSEFLLKHMLENKTDCQFNELKNDLFEKFNSILNQLLKIQE